jgi:hypothetical protein
VVSPVRTARRQALTLGDRLPARALRPVLLLLAAQALAYELVWNTIW